jgi:Ca2+-binding RTX toxin-like protein
LIARRTIWAIAFTGLLFLLAPAAAGAALRFAAPGGGGTACTEVAPCDIQTAVEASAVTDGDEVVLFGGTYSTGTDPLVASDAIYIHPAAGAGRPSIDSNSGFAVVLGHAGATLEGVELHTSAAGIGLILGVGARAQRMISIASANGASGCYLQASAASPPQLGDSACIATGSGGTALIGSAGVTAGDDAVVVLRHVTAVATGPSSTGVASTSSGSGGSVTVDAASVIANGTSTDASAVGGSGGSAAIADFSFSNYDSQLEGTHGSVTDPGAGTNQTGPAMLADPAAGDVHQLAGSFTIDRGARDAAAGSLDIDGESRSQGAAPDIGADEFTVLRRGPKCFGQSATLLAPGGPTPVSATPGRDVIVGTPGPDLILAQGGDDLVCGGGGRDTIRAGAGADEVDGGGGPDSIFGQGGRDLLRGGGGRDRIKGGPGRDRLAGQAGSDRLVGGGGRDRCRSGSGKDRIASC